MLAAELQDLKGEGIDLAALGFHAAEIDQLLSRGAPANEAEEATPEPPGMPVSRPGDIWQLGPHRIACGDSTDPRVVHRLLSTYAPKLMVTDPPYGVEYDANWRNEANWKEGNHGGRAIGAVSNDDRADWSAAWKLFPGDVVYVWHATMFGTVVQASLEAAGFAIRSQIIWAKNNFAIGRGDYHWQHEGCWYGIREGATSHWAGDRKQTTLWSIDKPQKSETGHSTQKPVEAMRRPMLNNSQPGEAVYDPFLGSGTTIIAAETCGRVGLGVELEPGYVDVGVKRWQEFAGKQAVLQGDGRDFATIAAARRKPKPAKRVKPAADTSPNDAPRA
jgi:DNA modification methylase